MTLWYLRDDGQALPHTPQEQPVCQGTPEYAAGLASVPPPEKVTQPPAFLTIITSMFMHGGWLHIIFNMLFLWVFGNNVEDSMGRLRYLFFYLICGVAAAAVVTDRARVHDGREPGVPRAVQARRQQRARAAESA